MNAYIEKIEELVLRAINRVVYGGKPKPKGIQQLSGAALNDAIYNGLIGKEPFMAARYGYNELQATLYPYICELPIIQRYKLYVQKRITFLHPAIRLAQKYMNPLCNNAGFFPNDIKYLSAYSEQVRLIDTPLCDCCGFHWGKEDLLSPFFSNKMCIGDLADMEPYDYAQPWSRALAGKKVLVVHPFADTIEKQYLKREQLWENKNVLPEFELKTIKAVQSIAGEEVPFKDWFEALQHMEEQMNAIDYDIAIIGCGAYGFSLAAHAKRMGKKAIHLGGATQILFGIKGKRWDELPAVNEFYNEYWVYPSADDTPKHKERVEGGCYW